MRLSRSDIIGQALQRAGNNTATLKAQARIKLNRILQDHYLQWDWPFLWRQTALTVPPNGTVTLPDDFLKAEDDQSLVIETVDGITRNFPMQEVDHLAFTQMSRPAVTTTTPRIWTVDYAAKTGTVWPRPFTVCDASLRYKFLPPDVPVTPAADYDADVPTFPWDGYLSDCVLQWAMEYEADPRANDQLQKNQQQLALIRGATWPERSYRSTIPLDPVFFGPAWRGDDWGW